MHEITERIYLNNICNWLDNTDNEEDKTEESHNISFGLTLDVRRLLTEMQLK